MTRLNLIIFILLVSGTAACSASDTTLIKNNSIGITFGSPGGLNLHYGRHFNDRWEGYIFAGGWFSGAYGFKGSVHFKFYQTGSFENRITFNAGYGRHDYFSSKSFWSHLYTQSNPGPAQYDHSWFIGPGYTMKWDWFILQFDILAGGRNYESPKLELSFGYTYTF